MAWPLATSLLLALLCPAFIVFEYPLISLALILRMASLPELRHYPVPAPRSVVSDRLAARFFASLHLLRYGERQLEVSFRTVLVSSPSQPDLIRETMAEPTGATGQTSAQMRWSLALLLVVAVILMAGVLFGYDQGVISGALSGIKQRFALGPLLTEVVTSWVTLGALFGSLIGGELADRMGRKKAVLCAGALFTLGALIQALAPDTTVLVLGHLGWWDLGLALRPSRLRSMAPKWRQRRGAAASFPPISSPSRSVFSSPISSIRNWRRAITGG